MTATTTNGVKCGNCGSYHGSAAEVRACYQAKTNGATNLATQQVFQGIAAGSGLSTTTRDPNNPGAVMSRQINERWNKPATSPLANGPKATERQLAFLEKLLVERPSKREAIPHPENLTKAQASQVIDGLLQTPKETGDQAPAQPQRSAQLPDVPAGHYAIPSLTGNNDLDFFRVDRPTEGQYKGRTYVKRVIGGKPSMRVQWSQVHCILQAIVDAGPAEAAQRYGHEIGRCSRCNRHLTDEESRRVGMGPDCRKGES